jgi:hypothetical protein
MLTEIKPVEHFRELVDTAIESQRVETTDMARFYISSLLASFVTPQRLTGEALAIRYLKALNSGRAEQATLMRDLGDVALFTSGFFSDSLKRSIVDVDYYVLMGAASYGFLAAMYEDAGARDSGAAHPPLYSELSGKFDCFVDILSEVSERSRLTSSGDVLRVYERWLKTGSALAGRILRDMGIDPVEVGTRPVH